MTENNKINFMGEFPSGQRGQTVNLLRFVSMVRIRPPPPKQKVVFHKKYDFLFVHLLRLFEMNNKD